MKKTFHAAMLALLLVAPQKEQVWTANIDQIRHAARMIPGTAPLRVNVLKFAESRRTKNFSVKGAPAEPSVQARTVFQIVYADGYVMVDSGMDQQVHNFSDEASWNHMMPMRQNKSSGPFAARAPFWSLMNTAIMSRESSTHHSLTS